jgi:hypothetical protein
MSNIKVAVSVVDSSGILAEVSIASGNNFTVAATYEPTIVSLSYVLIKADVFNPFALFDTASISEVVLRHPKPVYSDLAITSETLVKSIITPDVSDSAVTAELFASTLVKSVDFNTATAEVDSEPVTTSEVFVLALNALDSNAFNRYSFNGAGLN